MTRSRECLDEYGYESDIECNGTATEMIECIQWTELCDESWQVSVFQVPVWSQWSEWNSCSVTCGDGKRSRNGKNNSSISQLMTERITIPRKNKDMLRLEWQRK